MFEVLKLLFMVVFLVFNFYYKLYFVYIIVFIVFILGVYYVCELKLNGFGLRKVLVYCFFKFLYIK